MRDLAKNFLSEDEQRQVEACVREVEAETAAEVVPYIAAASHHYPRAELAGSMAAAVFAALIVSLLLDQSLWAFLITLAATQVLAQQLLRRYPALKRPFLSPAEVDEEVEEATIKAFYQNGLYRTRDATGIIIYISVYEHRAWVLADEGIDARVDPAVWQQVVDDLTTGIKAGQRAEALCTAVARCGELVREHFPRRADDENELSDLIVEQ